jgi:hypothetical protein
MYSLQSYKTFIVQATVYQLRLTFLMSVTQLNNATTIFCLNLSAAVIS